MKLLKSCLVLLALICISNVWSQQEKKRFKIHTVAFYNLENLFDTINDPLKYDEASPMMELKANRSEVYKKKIKNMARVVASIGSDKSNNSPAIIGVCEIENRAVLEDLVNDPLLLGKDYGIIHFDGPDRRSIDVALLYQKALFRPIDSSSHELKIYDDVSRKRVYTRDQLLVSGQLEGDLIHLLVNHWPSRSGGEARSRSKRVGAAKLNKHLIDSLQSIDPYAKIFTMGDLNDDPTNASVKKVLKAQKDKSRVPLKGIYNPFEKMFTEKGYGTTAYRDAWSLFDQIMVTKPLLDDDYSSFRFWKAGIYNKAYLTNKRGRWEGYPFRSFADGGFTDGFSDHFPVYVYLIKEVKD
ncbi:endonuclease/exonuclease/phosphatase family protein [Winogradskyella sp.]|uniref:endonuclease/exonuclease/phosphatase family protein n=1 Tax=uncultured Winogradskyella sp. TaxID=395353 RepID=UPI0023327CB4|nr:endonuclease/exonuclease/phosphatase family protein [Winogradskyella sp.]MDC0009265.1 endonuclease/exonuclease/phosphatase family protein [Winogradskyella sp.]MDC1504718.1 endonuclease/exonuclease/phosphatase family protein [Winogradskyella sp.]|tara:strand:- start:185036 stop:186097 length:1062 start_codon:yes stop_codon:yes gene_type:complete